jgi:hypothetical protein
MLVDRIPDICFATRHPVKDFDTAKEEILPNLDEIKARVNLSKKKESWNKKTTYGNKTIAGAGESLYYSKRIINGEVEEIFASYDQIVKGGEVFDMQPLIWYVIRGPLVDLSTLPALDCDRLFHKSEAENDFLRFSICNAEIDDDTIMGIPDPSAEFGDFMEKVQSFGAAQDFALLRAIDGRVSEADE